MIKVSQNPHPMKNPSFNPFSVLFAITILFVSCEEQEQVIDLSENPEKREEIYQQILNDDDLLTEFMNEMRKNPSMMRNLYTREQVEATMMADPVVMDSVLMGMYRVIEQDSMLLRNPERRERMMQNMTNMMSRDTSMYREMQERMQEGEMGMRN